jgi:2-haloacid dehalogenase
MARVIVFDVNETLPDLKAIEQGFARICADGGLRREWFGQLLQSALVATVTDAYVDFATIGRAALTLVAARHGTTLDDEGTAVVREGMRRQPPHPDVRPTLARRRAAVLRIAALSNNPPVVVDAQVASAGLTKLFEQNPSVDEVRRLKLALDPQLLAAARLCIPIEQIRLLAAHGWDVAGALRAGAAAAFVARPGQVFDPLVPLSDVLGDDLHEVAQRTIDIEC